MGLSAKDQFRLWPAHLQVECLQHTIRLIEAGRGIDASKSIAFDLYARKASTWKRAGEACSPCRYCGEPLMRRKDRKGRLESLDPDGTLHKCERRP